MKTAHGGEVVGESFGVHFNHFVVLDWTTHERVFIIDPRFGRRSIPLDLAAKSFTGVALMFERFTGDTVR